MIPITDFERRSNEGSLMKSDEFDLILTKKVRELVKKYEIKYNPQELITDDDTADRIFKAGIELLVDVGVYHNDTQRTLKWTKEEIEQIVSEYMSAPQAITFGKGKDKHTITPRIGNEKRRPTVWGCALSAIPEDMFIPIIQAMAQEESVVGLGGAGGVLSVGNVIPMAGTPSEIYCGLWEVGAQKEALRRAGRPDLHLGLVPTVSTTGGTAALLAPGLREPQTSMVGVHIIPEQKIDWTRLNLSYLIEQRGVAPWCSAMSLVGGLCGGPAGVAVGLIANLLGQLSYCHGNISSIFANDMQGQNSCRGAIWAYAAAVRAANRNLGIMLGTTTISGGPVFTYEELLYRSAIVAVASTGSGAAYNWSNGMTGLETRITADLMDSIIGMGRDQLNKILNTISELIEGCEKAGGTPLSIFDILLPFPTKYDITSLKPLPEYIKKCGTAIEILTKAGIPFTSKLKLN